VGVLIGSNSRIFDPMREAGINAQTFRAYRDQFNLVPKGWPVKESVPEALPLLSIRPVPNDLLAGRLDEQLRTFIAQAPPGVRLSAWHEASNLAGYPGYITAGTMSAVHEYMQDLCRGSNVGYGSIICAVPSQTKPWMGAGLDWYGLDIYDFGGGQFRSWYGGISKSRLFARLDDMLETCRELSGRDAPEIDICETNSPRPRYRAEWFTLLAEWMSANGGRYLETFWNPTGPLSGPWLPEDEKTVAALRSIATTLPGVLSEVIGVRAEYVGEELPNLLGLRREHDRVHSGDHAVILTSARTRRRDGQGRWRSSKVIVSASGSSRMRARWCTVVAM
jgi:hypothetical protein